MFVSAITVQYSSRQLRWKIHVHKPKPKHQKRVFEQLDSRGALVHKHFQDIVHSEHSV